MRLSKEIGSDILAANLVAMKMKAFTPVLYAPLLASLVIVSLVPTSVILGLSVWGRMLWVLLLVPLPIFFAGLIFSTTFRESTDSAACFGANLIGATIGGLAEYLGMAIGYQWLAALIIASYVASFVLVGRKREGRGILVD